EITRTEAQYEVEHFWMGGLRRAVVEGDVERGSMMAGQSVGLVKRIESVADIIKDLVSSTEAELQRVREMLL
ncbi:MAG TPA: 2-nitropropane dioxygenase, partial [Lentisphaeria bacterium]|nr:2-nitropropane dioxygenase [Lentisphaeria bacterium]